MENPTETKKTYQDYVDKKSPNEIASFLGRIDPVYHRFVENIFKVCTKMAPKADDNLSNSDNFVSILERNTNSKNSPHIAFDNHTWFSDPSPYNMFQFCLHHFLMFGRSSQLINVWKCQIRLENGKDIIVPWVSSVHVGEEFSKTVTNNPPPNLKCSSEISGVEFKKHYDDSNSSNDDKSVNNTFKEKKTKWKSISIWNIESELSLRPTDPYIIAEWTKENLPFKPGETRVTYANKIISKVVTQIDFKVKLNKTFMIMIDQKIYGPINYFAISPLKDPYNNDEQLQMRFATFYSPIL